MRANTLIALLGAIALLLSVNTAAVEAGFRLESFEDSARARPIMLDWWYPVDDQPAEEFDYGLGRGQVVEAGAIAQGSFPLVLLSHGALGSARNYSWIAEHLARNGYLVAGVSHFGESYVYGAETIDPASVLRWWERPLDISAALSFILSDSVFAASADSKRIGFLGHSSGGATAISLAGALFDSGQMANYCTTAAARADRGCDYARLENGTVTAEPTVRSKHPSAKSYADTRIQTFVALDPALGPGFVNFAAIDPELNMLLIGSAQNDFLPFAQHAKRLSHSLPSVTTHWLTNGEGHFVYLNECDLDLAANGVPLCKDRAGVSRKATHSKLSGAILQFFDQHHANTALQN